MKNENYGNGAIYVNKQDLLLHFKQEGRIIMEKDLRDDKEMLEALKESIKVWKSKTKRSNEDCPLCSLCIKRRREAGDLYVCHYCIIKKRTGQRHCLGTPFHNDKYKPFLEYKRNMVNYLESFLPQEKEEIKMRKVVMNKSLNQVGINDVNESKVYGYRLEGGRARLLRNIGGTYKWISMESTSYSSDLEYTPTADLRNIIEQVCTDYKGIVYEFDTMDEFHKWALTNNSGI